MSEATPTAAVHEVEAARDALLQNFTEAGRLRRARAESRRVNLQVDGPELFLAAVGNYNVVLDLSHRRIQHGCRDFLGQSPQRHMCKHVAALLLAIDAEVALMVLRGLADPASGWGLEVIAARGFST